MVDQQNIRLTETNRRQEKVIACMYDEMFELKNVVKKFQDGEGSSSRGPDGGTRVAQPLKLDLPRFAGKDPKGWLYQASEYFAYYEITDDAKLQIVGFYIIKEALGWVRGLRNNNLLMTWEKFTEDLLE